MRPSWPWAHRFSNEIISMASPVQYSIVGQMDRASHRCIDASISKVGHHQRLRNQQIFVLCLAYGQYVTISLPVHLIICRGRGTFFFIVPRAKMCSSGNISCSSPCQCYVAVEDMQREQSRSIPAKTVCHGQSWHDISPTLV